MNKKYSYSYPEQKKLGKQLSREDFLLISSETGYSVLYCKQVLRNANRTNESIVEAAKRCVEINNLISQKNAEHTKEIKLKNAEHAQEIELLIDQKQKALKAK